jgi:hypothetical protein
VIASGELVALPEYGVAVVPDTVLIEGLVNGQPVPKTMRAEEPTDARPVFTGCQWTSGKREHHEPFPQGTDPGHLFVLNQLLMCTGTQSTHLSRAVVTGPWHE